MKMHGLLILLFVFVSTAGTQNGKFTVAFWGDSRSNSGKAAENICGYLLNNKGTFIDVHWQNGDITSRGSDTCWEKTWSIKNFAQACTKDFFFMCTSNHEAVDNKCQTNYNNYMGSILPSNGSNVYYYHKSWALPASDRKVHLCAVDLYFGSELSADLRYWYTRRIHPDDVAAQKNYFTEKLADAGPHDWIVLLWHPPTYNEMTYKPNDSIAMEFAEWFEEKGADFVLNGDAHVYRRTHVIKSSDRSVAEVCQGSYHTSPSGSKGMIHIVNGRGGVFDTRTEGSTWAGHAVGLNLDENIGMITLMEFDDNKVTLKTIGIGGSPNYAQSKVYDDSFTWERGPASDGKPAVGLDPTALFFSVSQDDASNPPSQDVTISNVGSAGTNLPTLTASSNKSWLTTFVVGDNQKITNTVDRASATVGTDTATVTVSGSGVTSVTYKVHLVYKQSQVYTGISITPQTASLLPSQTLTFSAIAVDQEGDPMASQPSFSWSVGGQGAISTSGVYTASSSTGGPYTITATATIGSTQKQGTAQVLVTQLLKRINAGGGTVSGWDSQAEFVNSTSRDYSTTTQISVEGVANAGPAALYQTARHYSSDGATGPVFTFPSSLVPEGNYAIRLHFAEPHFTTLAQAADNRKMSVEIQGNDVLTNFSPATSAGATQKAYVWEGLVTVSGSNGLTIALTRGIGSDAFVQGMEIYAAGSEGSVSFARGGLPARRPTGVYSGRSGQLSVVVSQPGEHRIEIFSLKGAVVASVRGLGSQVYSLSTSGLPAAAYIARIVTPTESVQKTFLVTGRK